MARCEGCIHHEICLKLAYSRIILCGDNADKRCKMFKAAAEVAPRAEVEKLQEVNADLNESLRLAAEANKDLQAATVEVRAVVAREIFWEMDKLLLSITIDEETEESFVGFDFDKYIALKKKYTEDAP